MLGAESLYKLDAVGWRINVKLYTQSKFEELYVNIKVSKDKLYYFDEKQQRVYC
jgi:hypothetical protein